MSYDLLSLDHLAGMFRARPAGVTWRLDGAPISIIESDPDAPGLTIHTVDNDGTPLEQFYVEVLGVVVGATGQLHITDTEHDEFVIDRVVDLAFRMAEVNPTVPLSYHLAGCDERMKHIENALTDEVNTLNRLRRKAGEATMQAHAEGRPSGDWWKRHDALQEITAASSLTDSSLEVCKRARRTVGTALVHAVKGSF